MIKRLMVGELFAHAEVKKGKGGYNMVIRIPFGHKEFADSCFERLGRGEKIVERKERENG